MEQSLLILTEALPHTPQWGPFEQCCLTLAGPFTELLSRQKFSIISKFSFTVSVVDDVVDRNSVKLIDKSSVVVENAGLKLEDLDKNAVVYQSMFSRRITDLFFINLVDDYP